MRSTLVNDDVPELSDGEAVVQLCRTASGRSEGGPRVEDPSRVLSCAGVSEGQPFVLGADGSYDVNLNRFFRELDGWGVRSKNGIAAYSRDVMLFCRFLHESRGGKSIWACDGADLRAYKIARLRTPGPDQVSVGTWNRSLAALDKWVRWSIYEGMLDAEPFRYVDKTIMTPDGLKLSHVNSEHESDEQRAPMTFVEFEEYLLWRDVGLRGELPDGRLDPNWRGRHGERNAVFADLLVQTGMRLGEAASLLVPEVPPLHGVNVLGDIHLSPAVTKREKSRTVYLPLRNLRALHHYLEIERDELVQRMLAGSGYQLLDDHLAVIQTSRHSLKLHGERAKRNYSAMDMDERRRLVQVNTAGEARGPLLLWLGEDGTPLKASTWQSAFRRANERCAKFDIPVEIHPHTLRHLYAVHMLGLLLRQTIRALGQREDRRLPANELRRLLIGNPMRKLQLLLGHKRESTMYLYLDVLDNAQEIVHAALAEWDAQVEALAQIKADAAGAAA